MFAGKATSLAYRECSTRVGSGLKQKHYNRLERLVRDKHSSLFLPFVIYKEKRVVNTAPGPLQLNF
jgi:hypothetical protein